MKNLLKALLLGSIFMITSQLMELLLGQTKLTVVLNAIGLAGFGIGTWGLHFLQTQNQKNNISLTGAILLTIGSMAFVGVSIIVFQGLQSGNEVNFTQLPIYFIAGGSIVLGTIVFALSMYFIKYFPAWVGLLLVSLPLINLFTEMVFQVVFVRNILNTVMSLVFIYLCIKALKGQNRIVQTQI